MPRTAQKPIEETQGYERARRDLGLSRADVASYAKRAGYNLAPTALSRLEEKGEEAVGSRGLSKETVDWINYLYGIGDAEATDWTSVEQGAPVIVHGERGAFQYRSANADGSVAVFGGERNKEKFRSFDAGRVRLVSASALPAEEDAGLFENRGRGSNSVYAQKVLGYFQNQSGAHSVGALAYSLGLDNGVVSRVTATLAKAGTLQKVGRGVYVVSSDNAIEGTTDLGTTIAGDNFDF